MRLVDLLYPVFHIIEGFAVGDGVYQDDTSCSLVISLSDGFEAFLASGIPNLHFDLNALDVNSFDFEVHADGGHVGHLVLLVDVPQQNVRLAHRRVPDYHQLHQVVVFLLVSSLGHLLLVAFELSQTLRILCRRQLKALTLMRGSRNPPLASSWHHASPARYKIL